MYWKKGFIVAEVLVILSVLLLLAALVIPILLDNSMSANELATVSSIKTVVAAVKNFKTTTGNFPRDLTALANSKPPLLDGSLAGGLKDGYAFTYKVIGSGNFMVIARPQVNRGGGVKSFFADGSGVIRWTKADLEPRPADQLLQ